MIQLLVTALYHDIYSNVVYVCLKYIFDSADEIHDKLVCVSWKHIS